MNAQILKQAARTAERIAASLPIWTVVDTISDGEQTVHAASAQQAVDLVACRIVTNAESLGDAAPRRYYRLQCGTARRRVLGAR